MGLVGGAIFDSDDSPNRADADKRHSTPKERCGRALIDTGIAPLAVLEHLGVPDHAAFGAASGVAAKFVADTDPAPQRTGAPKARGLFACSENCLIDTENAPIQGRELTRAGRRVRPAILSRSPGRSGPMANGGG